MMEFFVCVNIGISILAIWLIAFGLSRLQVLQSHIERLRIEMGELRKLLLEFRSLLDSRDEY
jgi:hypothetical protein